MHAESLERCAGFTARKKTPELTAINAEIAKLEQVVPLITKRVAALKTLQKRRLVSENDFLTLEQERVEQVQDLAVLRARLTETTEAITQAKAQQRSLQSEFESRLHTERAEVETRLAALQQELIKAQTRTGLQKLRAPVDGVVQQLAVHTIGGVVTPAQALMVIVPNEHALEVEAFIQNKDIGFVQEGQPAEIKIDAFPFTRYGIIDGQILDVSNDAVENDTFGWVFGTRLRLARNTIQVEGRLVSLTPGMSVAVEVKTGKRRLIEYFLSPLLRYRDESVGER